ncbi:hypothetical protein B4109_2854 [Geobacillus stearothermophilus]|uniref:Uncharacterized protein n=1 Tax=Geobacillus stearothermophilus TaxID=1422 RepID=A0A150MIC7_GEOSE|nr:hypothetical protein B4109_2854 [Geobacillus stearothermophilus]
MSEAPGSLHVASLAMPNHAHAVAGPVQRNVKQRRTRTGRKRVFALLFLRVVGHINKY